MSRTCNTVITTGKSFVQEFQKFLKCIYDVRELFSSDEIAYKSLAKFGEYLREIQSLFSGLIEQTTHSVLRTLTRMIKEDIRKVKDQGKMFERLSNDYDIALQKNADASKMKTSLCDDTSKILIATRSCFGHTSIDYTYHINILFDQHKVELIELLLSYINIHKAFFHQGHELFLDSEKDFTAISQQLSKMRQENVVKQKILEKKHDSNQRKCNLDDTDNIVNSGALLSVGSEIPRNLSHQSLNNLPSTANVTVSGGDSGKEGYLFKRSHNKFKTWSRRWFLIKNGQLLYMRRSASKDTENEQSIMVPDLRICTVRLVTDNDRRFVFEILSPNGSHLLQADSQTECDQWINSLQLAITDSFKSLPLNGNDTLTTTLKTSYEDNSSAILQAKMELKQKMIKEKIEYVRKMPGNDVCCDCDAENPEWASINIGIILCLQCCGAHRGLGVSLSKVRSLHMDSWDLETLLVMSELGNTIVNSIYEANMNGVIKITCISLCSSAIRRSFIESKYVQKTYLRPLPSYNQIQQQTRLQTYSSLNNNSSAIKRWCNPYSSHVETENVHPITNHSSCWDPNIYLYEGAKQRNVTIMLHALALGADKNYIHPFDNNRTPLIQAIESRSVPAAEFLLVNNAKVNLADRDGKTPLHFATMLANIGRGPIILLLKRGADPLLKDNSGIDSCAASMEIGDPDVITWYRLISLHKQELEEDPDAEKSYISILDDPVYMKEIARSPSVSAEDR
ncbi:unnamed protein product [Didymodactylos carnosus]|nr:unnamed protein product [Didymodactylos carnosus]CAF3994584.1 unnamed protein product [Didymodactylos carnosus]